MLSCDLGDGYAMPFIAVGSGPLLVLVHGSMGDFRNWTPVLGPLSQRYRVLVPSLRHCFPGRWTTGGDYTIARHTADVIAFLERQQQRVHLVGHSRGGHIGFRVAEQRPDLLASLILAEPGGDLDGTLMPENEPHLPPQRDTFVAVAAEIAAGRIDKGLELFINAIDGAGEWDKKPAVDRQELRDNAATLIGQLDERRLPYSRASVAAITTPTLLIQDARTKPASARNVRVLAEHITGARRSVIPDATHPMFRQDPVGFSQAVQMFVDDVIAMGRA